MFNPNLQIDDEVRYRIRPQVNANAEEDKTFVKIAPGRLAKHEIEVDGQSFPTRESLETWHRKNNPHLFGDEE
ncbi:MAG: hypothetical protein KF758_07570 [Anaerolineales bacterium]|nr:hypothetical protein [Anaerolineales bacterium]